jgi:hypothetical protein
MKAHWEAEDYEVMEWKTLPFTEQDIDLIHRGLAVRTLRRSEAGSR